MLFLCQHEINSNNNTDNSNNNKSKNSNFLREMVQTAKRTLFENKVH